MLIGFKTRLFFTCLILLGLYLSGVIFVILHEQGHVDISSKYGLTSVISYYNLGLKGITTASTLLCFVNVDCPSLVVEQTLYENNQVIVFVIWLTLTLFIILMLLYLIWRRYEW